MRSAQPELNKKRTFRGIDLDAMLDLTHDQLMEVLHRCFNRGLLLRRLVKAAEEEAAEGQDGLRPVRQTGRRQDTPS